jgi:MFS transporter, DHA1 family, multidrug resistance protein
MAGDGFATTEASKGADRSLYRGNRVKEHAASGSPSRSMIGLLGALTAFPSMSVDLYLPSLPTIARIFGRPPAEAALTVVVFLLGLGIGQLIYGPLSDRYGRRLPLLGGIAIYVVGSVGCALAPTLLLLTSARFLQALGGCAGVVIARAVVRDRWQGADVARIFSLLVLIMGAAPLLAPLAGSALLLVAGWRAIFMALAAFGLLMLAWVALVLPESRPPEVAEQARSEHPIRGYVSLLGRGRLVGYLVAAAFSQATLHTFIAISPDLFISTYSVPAQHYGWIFAANALSMIGGAQINQRLLLKRSPEWILPRANILGLGAGGAMVAVAITGWGGLPALLAPMLLMMMSIGFSAPNAMACAMSVDPRRSGSTAALVGAGQFGAGGSCGAVASLFYDGSPRSMCAVMLAAFAIVFVALRISGHTPRH